MRMAGIADESAYKAALDILLPMGEYFQVQDDQLDWTAPPEVLGKSASCFLGGPADQAVGTDILDNKCSWCINVALKHASPEQRAVLDVRARAAGVGLNRPQASYGRKDPAAEARVKQIYTDIDLPAKFAAYEQQSYEQITALIDALDESSGLRKGVFHEFLAKVYRRSH